MAETVAKHYEPRVVVHLLVNDYVAVAENEVIDMSVCAHVVFGKSHQRVMVG